MSRQPRVAIVDRLVTAVNEHDLELLVACFAEGYVNETPAHPSRGFVGREQVRRNWEQILARVPDVRARVVRACVGEGAVWTEWELSGTRRDSSPFLMRGVVIYQVSDDSLTAARLYLEPVEPDAGDVDTAVRRVAGAREGTKETS